MKQKTVTVKELLLRIEALERQSSHIGAVNYAKRKTGRGSAFQEGRASGYRDSAQYLRQEFGITVEKAPSVLDKNLE